jgi:metal-responsive CopG/Arc/MetJ family transcriptional regulator
MNKVHASHITPQKSRKDVIVSVRLPQSLIDELKDIQQVNHFMDLSDEIRFVVRRYCLSFLNSQGQQSSIQPPIELLAEQKRKEKLIEDLSKIIENLKGSKQSNAENGDKQ